MPPAPLRKVKSVSGYLDKAQSRKLSTSWGGVADWYDTLLEEGEGTFQRDVILPHILRLLDIKPGMQVCDVACGQGFFARQFASLGAKVLGVDVSPELIQLAKKYENKKQGEDTKGSVDYLVASADDMARVPDNMAHAVTIILALQNISKIRETLQECARILKSSGRLYIVLNHPAFRVPKASDWGFDDEKKIQYRRVERYLGDMSVPIDMHPGEKVRTYTVSFHRSLQTYMKSLRSAGFAITGIEEWISNRQGPKGKTFAALEQARKEIPLFLCLEAQKICLLDR